MVENSRSKLGLIVFTRILRLLQSLGSGVFFGWLRATTLENNMHRRIEMKKTDQEKTEELLAELDVYHKLDDVNKDFANAKEKLLEIIRIVSERRQELTGLITKYAEETKWSRFKPAYLPNFIEEPYVIEPSRTGPKGKVLEWRVYVPKMVEFHVGRLERATHSYNVFSVTQYMHHFAEIPEELSSRFPKLDIEMQVVDGFLLTEPKKTEETWSRYRSYVFRKEGPGKIRIKKGSEWQLIAQILEDGGLPFAPSVVDPNDLRPRSCKGFAGHDEWRIRDYQEEAYSKFMEYGAIGIYWPFGTGKSQFGLDLLDRIKGHKLIVCSTLSLKEQWLERLLLLPDARRLECHVVCYQSSNEINRLIKQYKEFSLAVFDEVHHLPAKTFMRLSTVPCNYRLGLTGSPYREDGHINYIMALTGYPMGLAWSKFIAEGIIALAQIQVHIVKNERYKLALLDDLLKRDLGKTMIFSDSLDLGDRIAHKYSLEWIHGATKKRLETIRRNERIVISRVGDEGLSIPELDTIIEIDFMGGSRMQALQRVGRLSHRAIKPDQEPAVHHIIMTNDELEKYGKRLLAYYDKGFKVDYLYHN